ncbi:hypothetical protein ACQB6R_03320 [Propionibacteriaceae bacterium G1746]|uniref:hypothetical protein n=1 Tax=Aestuariimicrobium sp. G57 TaxID=3418485 RepID=UPI003C1B229D
MSRPNRARLGAVALAVACAIALSACSQPGGGTAFEVAGEKMSLNQLADAGEACAAPLGVAKPVMDTAIRGLALQSLVGDALAKQNGLTFSDAQVQQVLANEDLAAANAVADCAPVVQGAAKLLLAAAQLGNEETTKQLKALDVQVNPRLGSWDADELALRNSNGSLSKVGPASLDSEG